MNNGVQAPFLLGLLETILRILHLLPLCIKHLAKSCIFAGQNLTFRINLQELASEWRRHNRAARHLEVLDEVLLEFVQELQQLAE